MATFPLKIMTPDGVAFDGAVTSVSCRTINGQLQLLARHIDICTALGMGEAHIKLEDGTVRRAACMGGMLSMLGGECHLLATTFEWADAIDAERAAHNGNVLSQLLFMPEHIHGRPDLHALRHGHRRSFGTGAACGNHCVKAFHHLRGCVSAKPYLHSGLI